MKIVQNLCVSHFVKRKVDVLFRDETIKLDANYKAINRYCIRASALVGTAIPTVRQLTGTASELVLL